MSRTTIVIPCYNEAKRLDAQRFKSFARAHHDIHFLFVDDGSSDDTLQAIKSLVHSEPDKLHWLALDRNSGKAEAVRS